MKKCQSFCKIERFLNIITNLLRNNNHQNKLVTVEIKNAHLMHSPERLDFHEKKEREKKKKKATNEISFLINELSMENCTTCYLTLIKGLKAIKKLRGLFSIYLLLGRPSYCLSRMS